MGEKAIRCSVLDEQVDNIMKSLALDPAWKERIIAKISAISEHDQILKERRRVSDKLRRLAKAYIDGLIEEGEYEIQRRLLQDNLEALVSPEIDDALHAGELLKSLGLIWEKATLSEKHKLLTSILYAVYIDLLATRSIVGLLPKPPFYSLFESLRRRSDSKLIIFNLEQLRSIASRGED